METPSTWSVLTSYASMIVVLFDLIKSALSSLAWPLTVMFGLALFRSDIVTLLTKIAAIKAAGFEAQFSQGVHQLDPLPAAAEATAEAVAEVVAQAEAGTCEQEPEEFAAADNDIDAKQIAESEAPDGAHEGAPPVAAQSDAAARSPDRTQEDSQARRNENKKGYYNPEMVNFWKMAASKGRKVDASSIPATDLWATLNDLLRAHSIDSTAAKDLEEARAIAPNSPSGGVLLAWRAIEGITQRLQQLQSIPAIALSAPVKRWINPTTVIRDLMRSDELDRETFERFMDLQKLRNSVAHASKFSPDPSDVMEYINRAEELAITLTSILNRLNTPQSQERAGPITP